MEPTLPSGQADDDEATAEVISLPPSTFQVPSAETMFAWSRVPTIVHQPEGEVRHVLTMEDCVRFGEVLHRCKEALPPSVPSWPLWVRLFAKRDKMLVDAEARNRDFLDRVGLLDPNPELPLERAVERLVRNPFYQDLAARIAEDLIQDRVTQVLVKEENVFAVFSSLHPRARRPIGTRPEDGGEDWVDFIETPFGQVRVMYAIEQVALPKADEIKDELKDRGWEFYSFTMANPANRHSTFLFRGRFMGPPKWVLDGLA